MTDGWRRCQIHGRTGTRWYDLETVRQLLEFGQAAAVPGLMIARGVQGRRGCVGVGQRVRLDVEVGGGGAAGSGWGACSATSRLDDVDVGVLGREGLGRDHVVALGYDGHVVGVGGVGVGVGVHGWWWDVHG